MNRIFRKCSNFGLMVRISNFTENEALTVAKDLIRGNIPVITIDISKELNAIKVLNKIAFNADLFIAAEGIRTITDAYEAAGNGAQFFIINQPDENLAKELKNNGFFFMSKVNNIEEINKCKNLGIEAVVISDFKLIEHCSLPFVLNSIENTGDPITQKAMFSIIDIDKGNNDYEKWINSKLQSYLGHNYAEIIIAKSSSENTQEFANIFASINKSKISLGDKNEIHMTCNNFTQSVNYLKWKEIYIDPNKSILQNGIVKEAPLDKKLNDFTIILKEIK